MTSTGQRNSRAHGRIGPRGSALAPLLRWRDWNIPVKLAAVMLVPVIVAIALGFVVIDGQINTAATYDQANEVTALGSTVRAAATALQDERRQAATPSPDAPGGPGWTAARKQTDTEVAAVDAGVKAGVADGVLDPVAQSAWAGVQRQLGELPSVRSQQTAATADPTGDVGVYTQLVGGLLSFDRVLISDLDDATMTRESMAIYDVFSAREEISYQQTVVLAGMGGGTMSADAVTDLHGSEARYSSRINDFRSIADPDESSSFDQVAGPAAFAQQSSLLAQAIDQSGGMTGVVSAGMRITVPVTDWDTASSAVLAGLGKAVDNLAGELNNTSQTLQDRASNAAGAASTVLFLALLLAAAIMAVIARQLLRSIGVLRRTARDVATRTLPEAVERIRLGGSADVDVAPVPVHTTDEVGQLARAFEAMQTEAVKLAVEQANLRGNYSDLFVNLSRRSQSLVQRQLRLIEQLERDEEDPDQLSALFKLDHLATRMRRNNENLMVLSGSDLGRGPSQAVPLADLLRASVSEIDQYQRVVVQPPPGVQIVGYAAGDLIRLIAELLDNATAFSSPESPVTIASHRTRSSAVVVDIVDHGIGMSDEDLARANERLSQPEGFEGRLSKRLGLFVVSRLAGQHGVRVRLHGGHDIPGLRVTVTAPAALVLADPDELPPPLEITAGPVAELPPGPSAEPDPVASALTVTIPQLPSTAGSGVDLFAPISDPDEDEPYRAPVAPATSPAPDERTRDRLAETTPIFDDMLSAWFHDASPDTVQRVQPVGRTEAPAAEPVPAEPRGTDPRADDRTDGRTDARVAARAEARPEPAGPTAEPDGDSWRFAADDGWRAVDAVSQSTPDTYTTAGLPKRQPKARLLPGSVAQEPQHRRGPSIAPPGETAEQVRARLAGFQQGIQRGRAEQVAPAGEAGATETPAPRPEPAETTAATPAGETNGQVNGHAPAESRSNGHAAEPTADGRRTGEQRPNGHAATEPRPAARNGRTPAEPGPDAQQTGAPRSNGHVAEPRPQPRPATESRNGRTPADAGDSRSNGHAPAEGGADGRQATESRMNGRAAESRLDRRNGPAPADAGANGHAPADAAPDGRPAGESRPDGRNGTRGRTAEESGPNGRTPGGSGPLPRPNGRTPGEPGSTGPNGRGPRGGAPAEAGPGGTLMFAPVDPGAGPAWPADAPADTGTDGGQTGAGLPRREARRTVDFGQTGSRRPEPGRPEPGRAAERGRPERQAEAIWPSAADVGWQAVQDVSRSEPDTYTPAGLPRRQPRARLLPGSVVASELPAPAGRGGLDANAVRDRLNSFQRGVRQGRNGSGPEHPGGADTVAVGDRRHEPAEHGFQWENE